jgi:hypothetical protein
MAVFNTPQREPIPHVLHPTPNRPTVKPIQPRLVAPAPDDKNGIPSAENSMAMLTLPPQPAPTAAAVYTDPNLRLPPSTLPPQQQVLTPQNQNQVPPQARQTTDGLGLLIEAFDTHQTAAGAPVPVPVSVVSVPGTTAPGPPPLPGAAYDPHAAPQQQQQYYSQPQPPPPPQAMGINDGYEHELGYYMGDGVGSVGPGMQQSWAGGGGDMYGY